MTWPQKPCEYQHDRDPGLRLSEVWPDDRPMRGVWSDRTQEYAARRRGGRPSEYEFAGAAQRNPAGIGPGKEG